MDIQKSLPTSNNKQQNVVDCRKAFDGVDVESYFALVSVLLISSDGTTICCDVRDVYSGLIAVGQVLLHILFHLFSGFKHSSKILVCMYV